MCQQFHRNGRGWIWFGDDLHEKISIPAYGKINGVGIDVLNVLIIFDEGK